MADSEGNTEEDWEVFRVLTEPLGEDQETMADEEMTGHDMCTTLRSELAALQYKRDRLLSELQEMKGQLRSRDQRAAELSAETEQLKEQAARQNAIIASLRRRIQELEEKERTLTLTCGRTENALTTLTRESRHHEDRARDLERQVARLELECHSEEREKTTARHNLGDFVRRLSTALGTEGPEPTSQEGLIHKASELVQETSRLRNRSANLADTLSSVEVELRSCRDALERALADRDELQRQEACHTAEIDRLRQEKENLEVQKHCLERDLQELKERYNSVSRQLGTATGDIAAKEVQICNLRDDLKQREEKGQRLQNELRHLLESLAILLSTPCRFVESQECAVKDRIRELLNDNKDKSSQLDHLKDKVSALKSQVHGLQESLDLANVRIRNLEDDKSTVSSRLHNTEAQLSSCEAVKENLRRDKVIFVTFLDRLARALNMDEISKEVGVDLQTESLLMRAEQLTRLESDKLIDKLLLSYPYCTTIPRLKRERSCCYPRCESAVVYQLQRRVRTLRDQLQRRDLHLDLLRRKLNLHEDHCKVRSLLEAERDDANQRVKKLVKQADKLQLDLNDARAEIRDLKLQLGEAADYKTTAIERARKIEELQKRLLDSEVLRTRCTRKVNLLKDQVKTTSDTLEHEKHMCDRTKSMLIEDLAKIKADLSDTLRRENSLNSFRSSVVSLLGLETTCPDYEIIGRLTKVMNAYREFSSVSRRYDDPVLPHVHVSPRRSPARTSPRRTPRFSPDHKTPRYDDSGFLDPLDDDSDLNSVYNKRSYRPS
ncbi:coiled-coil domain-containing protein 170-like isoform X2 [Macrosteles quadrilineatus]|uniref:coiled-coil domain-containing protein 170-like isoform X2 n=1 Tax=Macrosteles quadrilineatus TaxID=74068 RepID=UPI0023E1E74F|nr:coiled-coil domain-containing protein 170-like isoform X2 [Macrosteles quadrilineatus]